MGSYGTYDITRKDFIKQVLDEMNYVTVLDDGTKFTQRVIRHSLRGGRLWEVIEQTRTGGSEPGTCRFIHLDLIEADRSINGYTHRPMDESMSPCDCDCPLSFLDLVSEPINEWAVKWRQKVREWHATQAKLKAMVKAMQPGQWYAFERLFNAEPVKYVFNKRGPVFSVKGRLFRVRIPDLASARLLASPQEVA